MAENFLKQTFLNRIINLFIDKIYLGANMEVLDKEVVIENKNDYVQSFNTPIKKKKAKTAPNEKITYVKSFVLCIALSLVFIGTAIAVILSANEMEGTVPVFYPSTFVFVVVSVVCYVLVTVGLLLACKQGVNKKVYILYIINAVLSIALLTFLMIFGLKMVSLFLSLLVFYFAFTLMNELKKVNVTAFYMMLPYSLWTAFLVACAYALVMLN